MNFVYMLDLDKIPQCERTFRTEIISDLFKYEANIPQAFFSIFGELCLFSFVFYRHRRIQGWILDILDMYLHWTTFVTFNEVYFSILTSDLKDNTYSISG